MMISPLNSGRAGKAALLLLAASSVAAHELDMHGALAQGYVLSEGNQVLGRSTHGSRDFYEVALNGRSAPLPRLLLSGQLMARRAGAADQGKLRVDFAQLDYRAIDENDRSLGLRLGKVKNTFGFYNDTRDVVFSRPSIRLPNSVYFESSGFRDLFFSNEGGQIYASRQGSDSITDWTLNVARPFDATEDFERLLTQGALEGRVKIDRFLVSRLLHEWSASRYRLGLSYLDAEMGFESSSPQAPFSGLGLDVSLYVLSAQWRHRAGELTFEYLLTDTRFNSPLGADRRRSDGAYLQYTRYLRSGLSAYLRYDLSFSDRNDRDGREAEAAGTGPRHAQFSRDHVLGARWQFAGRWGLFGEYHYTDGTAGVSDVDNQGRTPERYWQSLFLMLAYRF